MKKIYYLKTCNTCQRILKKLQLTPDFILQDIKKDPIIVNQLEDMYALSTSYEALFNKRAKLYKEMGLKDQSLSEEEYKYYILQHYTFLKRPVVIIGDTIFIGNSQKTVKATIEALKNT